MAAWMMEAVDGADVTELVKRVKSLNFHTVSSIMQQVLMAIEHMHFAGFIHRDIKPANILLDRNGCVKVIDFDVNKLCVALAGSHHQMSFFARTANKFPAEEKAGTEAYMAPEVHERKEFGRASDWWSVGVVLFRLSFGRLPFRGRDVAEDIVNCNIDWDKIKTLPLNTPNGGLLKDFISQLLVKDPKQRLGSEDYNDIFEHRLFEETDWLSHPDEITVTDDMESFFAAKDKESDIEVKGTLRSRSETKCRIPRPICVAVNRLRMTSLS